MSNISILNNVKLYHFNFNSRAMVARAAMAYRNQSFEDHRIKADNWILLKYSGDFEFRVLPVLEVDGKRYSQMNAINTYLGSKLDLFYNDIEEDYKIISTLNSYEDIAGKNRQTYLLTSEEDRQQAFENFKIIHAPFYLHIYESRYNKWRGSYYIGNKFTLADIYVTCYLYNNFMNSNKLLKYKEDFMEKYAPNLKQHIIKIKENELKSFFDNYYIENEDKEEIKKISDIIRKT